MKQYNKTERNKKQQQQQKHLRVILCMFSEVLPNHKVKLLQE